MRSTRFFWWRAGTLTRSWQPVYTGDEENCNRTIGLRLPGGVLFMCLNVPLRQRPCDWCRGFQ
ncbi:hypothetical protein AB0942_33405 [Streptomyces nodosus]|uniref:hypothetical protein n=1 Tax=Streptomyces nodosus TaxID=40318 RepID=UPI00345637EC